jgi:hypothetical protein
MRTFIVFCLFLAVVLPAGRVFGDQFTDFRDEGRVLGIRCSDADDLLDDELDYKTVMQKLKDERRISAYQLFSAKTKKGILKRANLPFLGKWMKRVVANEFQEKNPEIVYRLLGRINDLLRISHVGCKNFPCKKDVTIIWSSYQDLVYNASRLSHQGMKQTVKLLKFVKAAVQSPAHAPQFFSHSVPIAKYFAKKYKRMTGDANTIEILAVKAMQNIQNDSVAISKRISALKEEFNATSNQLKVQKAKKRSIGCEHRRAEATFPGYSDYTQRTFTAVHDDPDDGSKRHHGV